MTHPHSERVVPVRKYLTSRPQRSCNGNIGLLSCILSTSNYTESAFMQYEGHCPLCVYVGYTPPGSLDILTANEIAKGEPCPSYLRQVNLKQDKQEQHREYLKMNKQVTTLNIQTYTQTRPSSLSLLLFLLPPRVDPWSSALFFTSSSLCKLIVHFRALQTPTPAGRRILTCPWRRTLKL